MTSEKKIKTNTEVKIYNFEFIMGAHYFGTTIAVILLQGGKEMGDSDSSGHNTLDHLL